MDEFRHGGKARSRPAKAGSRPSPAPKANAGGRGPIAGVPAGGAPPPGIETALSVRRPTPSPGGISPGFAPRRSVQPTIVGRPTSDFRTQMIQLQLQRMLQQGTASFQGGGDITAIPKPTTPGEILLGIRQALTPRFRKRGLLPSGREFISGRVSALGLAPDDFWADLLRGDPSGINPAAITRANFSAGGRVYSAPRFMVA